MALLEKAAGQGHVYAMEVLGVIHCERNEHEQALEWYTKAAEAGLPASMFSVGCRLDKGEGVAAPDYPAAAGWYRRADAAGFGAAALNLSNMYIAGRGGACQITQPRPPPHSAPSFLRSNGRTRSGEHYMPGSRARCHAQQAAGDEVETQGR